MLIAELDISQASTGVGNYLKQRRDYLLSRAGSQKAQGRLDVRLVVNKMYAEWQRAVGQSGKKPTGEMLGAYITQHWGEDKFRKIQKDYPEYLGTSMTLVTTPATPPAAPAAPVTEAIDPQSFQKYRQTIENLLLQPNPNPDRGAVINAIGNMVRDDTVSLWTAKEYVDQLKTRFVKTVPELVDLKDDWFEQAAEQQGTAQPAQPVTPTATPPTAQPAAPTATQPTKPLTRAAVNQIFTALARMMVASGDAYVRYKEPVERSSRPSQSTGVRQQ